MQKLTDRHKQKQTEWREKEETDTNINKQYHGKVEGDREKGGVKRKKGRLPQAQ